MLRKHRSLEYEEKKTIEKKIAPSQRFTHVAKNKEHLKRYLGSGLLKVLKVI